jgi:hypothetical protein
MKCKQQGRVDEQIPSNVISTLKLLLATSSSDPGPRQTPTTKVKRNEERRVESKIHKQPHQRRRRFKHNMRTYPGTNQRQQVRKTA